MIRDRYGVVNRVSGFYQRNGMVEDGDSLSLLHGAFPWRAGNRGAIDKSTISVFIVQFISLFRHTYFFIDIAFTIYYNLSDEKKKLDRREFEEGYDSFPKLSEHTASSSS
jgi:hypothetical protein